MSSFLPKLKQNTHSRRSQIHVGEITLQVVDSKDPGTVELCFHCQLLSEVTVLILLSHNYSLCYNRAFSAWHTYHFPSCIQKPSQAVVVGFPNMERVGRKWKCYVVQNALVSYLILYIYEMWQIGLSNWALNSNYDLCRVSASCWYSKTYRGRLKIMHQTKKFFKYHRKFDELRVHQWQHRKRKKQRSDKTLVTGMTVGLYSSRGYPWFWYR